MASAQIGSAITLDVGTTNTRARLLRAGEVVQVARRAFGIRDSIGASGHLTLRKALHEVIQELGESTKPGEPAMVVASGMLTAEVGLFHVPHVIAPAGELELAKGAIYQRLPDVADQPILFIPGIRTPPSEGQDGWAAADLMRGEECETIGAWHELSAKATGAHDSSKPDVFLWPGSHTKLVEVDVSGLVLRSHTSLAGELTMALARHTLLSASLPAEFPAEPDIDALEMGRRLTAREGLGRAAFLVRIGAITQQLSTEERAAFLIGAVLAEDAQRLAKQPMMTSAGRVWVGGRQPQRSIYANFLRAEGLTNVYEIPEALSEEAAARGALRVAACYQRESGR